MDPIQAEINAYNERIAALESEQNTLIETYTAREGGEPTEDETARAEDIDKEIISLQERLKTAEARSERRKAAEAARAAHPARQSSPAPATGRSAAVVRVEPRVYDRKADGSRESVILDAFSVGAHAAKMGSANVKNRDEANERIARHITEMRRDGWELPDDKDMRGIPVARRRAIARTQTTSDFDAPSSLVPTQYMADQVARSVKTGRPYADLCNRMTLPVSGTQLQIPRVTVTTDAGPVATEGAASETRDLETDEVTLPVGEVAGHVPITRFVSDRGVGIDDLILNDLAGELEVQQDRQILIGTGANRQVLGVFTAIAGETGTPRQIAATDVAAGSLTAEERNRQRAIKTWRLIHALAEDVAEGRLRAVDVVVMRQRRWTYLQTAVDSTGRPLFQTGEPTAMNVMGLGAVSPMDLSAGESVGSIAGIPVVIDQNIPASFTTAGASTGGDQDRILAVHRMDQRLFEAGVMFITDDYDVPTRTNTVGGHFYHAYTSELYPKGVASGGGTLTALSFAL